MSHTTWSQPFPPASLRTPLRLRWRASARVGGPPPLRWPAVLPQRLSGLVVLLAVSLAGAVPAGAAVAKRYEWRTLRHDARNSRTSPGKAKLKTPVTRWRVRVGGKASELLAADVTLDGQSDVIARVAGAIAARTQSGQLLWQTPPFGATDIVAVRDVTGDAVPDVVARSAKGVRVISLLSGAELWASPAAEFPELGFVHVADFDGDGVGDIALGNRGGFVADKPGVAQVVRLVGAPQVLFSTPAKGPFGGPVHAYKFRLGDLDGDGAPELITWTGDAEGQGWLYAYSGKDGKLLASTAKLPKLGAYSCVSARDGFVRCDTAKDTATGRGGVRMFLRDGTALKQAWSWLPDASPKPLRTVGAWDLDGDQKREIIVWREDLGLVALDFLTGAPLGTAWWPKGLAKGGPAPVFAAATVDQPLVFIRGAASDAKGASQTVAVAWSRAGGWSQVGALGAGRLVLPHVEAQQDDRPPSPATVDESGANALWLVDTDQDQLLDELRFLVLSAKAGAFKTEQVGKASYDALGLEPVWLPGTGGGVMFSDRAGIVTVATAKGGVRNDGDQDGQPDLAFAGPQSVHVRVGWLGAKDSAPHVLLGLDGRLLSLNGAGAGPTKPPVAITLLNVGTDPIIGVPADVDGDGDREVVARFRPLGKGLHLRAIGAKGTLWTWQDPDIATRGSMRLGPVLALLPGQVTGTEDIVVGVAKATAVNQGGFRLIRGTDGGERWPKGSYARGNDVFAQPGGFTHVDGEARFVLSLGAGRYHVRVSDGGLAFKTPSPVYPRDGVPTPVDIDNDGTDELLITAGAKGLGLETTANAKSQWLHSANQWISRDAALLSVKGAPHVATLTTTAGALELRDAATGDLVWEQRYTQGKAAPGSTGNPVLSGLVGVADLFGEGTPALLFVSSDGWLYAVSAVDGAVRWARNYGGAVGKPTVADVDGDGEVEVLVFTPDGFLEALDRDVLGKVGWVRENAGTGPALTDADDIDEQDRSDTVYLNWAELPGAVGYSVRLRTEAGVVIVPWTEAGKGTAATISDLSLQLGIRYIAEVRGIGVVDGQEVFSQATQSDGVQLKDLSAPEFVSLVATPALLQEAHTGSVFSVEARDAIKLVEIRCDVRDADEGLAGQVVRKANTNVVKADLVWDGRDAAGTRAPPGEYMVRCTAFDIASRIATAQTPLRVCPADDPTCSGPVKRTPVDGDADVGVAGECVDTGCGCQARGRQPVSWGSLAFLLLALALVWTRRRGEGAAG